jgi:hypothetical protein
MPASLRSILHRSIQVLLLGVVLFIGYPIAAAVTGLSSGAASGSGTNSAMGSTLFALTLVCLADALVLTLLVLNSGWQGWRLVVALFVLWFGIETFLSQMETFFFNVSLSLPTSSILRIVGSGAIRALLVTPAAVLLLRRRPLPDVAADVRHPTTGRKPRRPPSALVGAGLLLAAVYVLIYLTFGYFVAWQSSEVRLFYSGSAELAPFFTHLWNQVIYGSPTLIPFQFLRGILWVGLALLALRMTEGSVRRPALLMAALFGIVFSVPCLIPNPYLPTAVRLVHFIELLTSMTLFGTLAGWLLSRSLPAGRNVALSEIAATGT